MNPTARSISSTGSSFEPQRQRESEQDLGIGRAVEVGEHARLDREHQVAPHRVEAGEDAVVDEQPAPVAERMAVGLLDRRARGRAHMGEKHRSLDVRRELTQVRVTQAGATLW
jgi:hypothetical protein